MVLEEYRKSADTYLTPFAKYMTNANPNNLTITAFVFAIFAGITFALTYFSDIFLLFAALFIFLNGLFDALDGKVARMSTRATIKGDYLDHVLDRYADAFIIGGILVSPYCNPVIGLLALIGVIYASYMGTQAQAVGCGRKYIGILSRADRLTILIFTPIIQYILLLPGRDYFTLIVFDHKLYFTEFIMLYFAVAGHITAAQRIYHTLTDLDKKMSEKTRVNPRKAQLKNMNEKRNEKKVLQERASKLSDDSDHGKV
jgi:archaetidylinositol phosphate synthase